VDRGRLSPNKEGRGWIKGGLIVEKKVQVRIKSRKEPIYEEKVCQGVDRGKRPEKSSNAQE
jgi:hypothetical protein